MSERDRSRSRGLASSTIAAARPEISERTPDRKAEDTRGLAGRELGTCEHLLSELEIASARDDLGTWTETEAQLDEAVKRGTQAVTAALEADHGTAHARDLETRLAEVTRRAGPDCHAPKGYQEVSQEAELPAAVNLRPEGSVKLGMERKEAAIKAVLDLLSPADSRVLVTRVGKQHSEARNARPAEIAEF